MQGAWFLSAGARIRRAVGRVAAQVGTVYTQGTGFLISPRLFITNQHVLTNLAAAKAATIRFDFEYDEYGQAAPTTDFALDPDAFSLWSPIDQLDYAVIALGAKISGPAAVTDLGYIALSNSPDKHVLGMNVNVIQHPQGMPKMIAVRNNTLVVRTPNTLLYTTDTEEGSSGSPVLNDEWEAVALHHFAGPYDTPADQRDNNTDKTVNEGIRISAIYTALAQLQTTLDPTRAAYLAEALSYATQPAPVGQRLGPPKGGSEDFSTITPSATEGTMNDNSTSSVATVMIPLEVSIRIAGGVPAAAVSASNGYVTPQPQTVRAAPTLGSAGGAKVLGLRSEAVVIDPDYSDRKGYNEAFISNVKLLIPMPKGGAVPVDGDPDGVLKYTHYSVVLNKSKKMAFVTATNIDGNHFMQVNRTTGEARGDAEGDKWFVDTRVPPEAVIGQDFYSGWSNIFDRGHLTRREDTNWGKDAAESEKGNADTFHFTNCTPQHWRFNESADYWQGAERYVLENGTLAATEDHNKIVVFQGPLFDNDKDRMADDIQVPSRFFKVIVWRSHDKELKAVGLVVDQSALLDEQRGKGLGPPKALKSIDVQQFRVSMNEIAEASKLSFADAIMKADTFEDKDQPNVGEARKAILLRTQSDVLPIGLRKDAVKTGG